MAFFLLRNRSDCVQLVFSILSKNASNSCLWFWPVFHLFCAYKMYSPMWKFVLIRFVKSETENNKKGGRFFLLASLELIVLHQNLVKNSFGVCMPSKTKTWRNLSRWSQILEIPTIAGKGHTQSTYCTIGDHNLLLKTIIT